MAANLAIIERSFRLDSHTFYPRPSHFKKRLDSLISRFNNLVGFFGDNFQDLSWRRQINESWELSSKTTLLHIIGNDDSFNLPRCVVTVANEWAKVPDPAPLARSGDVGLYITVCCIKIEDGTPQSIATIQRILNHASDWISKHVNDSDLFKSLFIYCEITSGSENEIARLRNYINDCLLQKSKSWKDRQERIVMGPDKVTLVSLISNHIEQLLMQNFYLIYEYLDRFICRRFSQRTIGDITHEEVVKELLYAFVRNDADLADMRKQSIYQEDTRTESDKFLDIVIDCLVKKFKCAVIEPLSNKLGMQFVICSICLDEIRFDLIVKKNLSIRTRDHLKKLREFSENRDKIIHEISEATTKGIKRKRPKNNDYMVHGLQNDLSAALNEAEKKLLSAVRQIEVMRRMQFEIEGYFRLAGITVGEPPSKIPEALHRELLQIDGVIGAGTIYGLLEVHVKDKNNEIKLDIDDIIRRHNYTKHYVVRVVKREPSHLASVQHEHGNWVKSPDPDQPANLRKGTLGIFAEGVPAAKKSPKSMYALTCAHVVNPLNHPEHPVYVIGNGARLRKLGVSKPELTVNCGMTDNARLIDIAAVQVEKDLQQDCQKYVKDEEGFPKQSYVLNCSPQEMEKLQVYKFGANSGCTRGLVCSHEYICKINTTMQTDYIIVVDGLPGAKDHKEKNFAMPGDSGSIVCMPSIAKDKPVGVAIVAMVSAGGFQLEGFDSNLCLSFQLSKGIDTLTQKAGLRLTELQTG